MRFVAWTLIIVSLVFSIVSAVTAYLPKTTLADDNFVTRADDGSNQPLTLGAPAGKQVVDGKPEPLAKPGERLTPELLARLRAAGQNRVRVKEFSVARWSEWWVFALGCLGMLGGAMLIRRENARQVVTGAEGRAEPGGSAESELESLRSDLAALRKGVSATTDPTLRLQLI